MKKNVKVFAVLALALLIGACGAKKETPAKEDSKLANGLYQAIGETAENGWTNFVNFEVKNGKIDTFKYDSVNLMEGSKETKSMLAKEGKYNLADGNAGKWSEQIAKVEAYVIENQGAKDIKFDDKGKSDTISGATVSFGDINDLIEAAKTTGPVTKGKLSDGVYFAKDATPDDKGFTFILGYYVSNGVILGAYTDAYLLETKDGKEVKSYKTIMAKAGNYDLKSKVGSYDEQAKAISDYIVAKQGLDVEVNEEGKSDAISGATVSVSHWVKLFSEAK